MAENVCATSRVNLMCVCVCYNRSEEHGNVHEDRALHTGSGEKEI